MRPLDYYSGRYKSLTVKGMKLINKRKALKLRELWISWQIIRMLVPEISQKMEHRQVMRRKGAQGLTVRPLGSSRPVSSLPRNKHSAWDQRQQDYEPLGRNCRRTLLTQLTDRFFGWTLRNMESSPAAASKHKKLHLVTACSWFSCKWWMKRQTNAMRIRDK